MKRGFIVEFAGLSGIGKSTLCSKIYEKSQGRRDRYGRLSLEEKSEIAKKPTFSNLVTACKVFYVLALVRPRSFDGFRRSFKDLYRINTLYAYYLKNPGIYLSHEGLFHKLLVLSNGGRNKDMMKTVSKALELFLHPDLVILLKASDEEIARRRRERRDVPYRSLSRQETAGFAALESCVENYSVSEDNNIKYLLVDNERSGDLDKITEEIMRVIECTHCTNLIYLLRNPQIVPT